jgi:type IV secretory pathway VirB4 component
MIDVWPRRRQLRLARHRSTTAHLCSAYPFPAEAGLGDRGVYLGTNLLTGGGGFAFDPFETYANGMITNPNMLLAGEPGVGKSATAKTFVYRSAAVFGRWVAIADPKGEYRALADALGLSVVDLHPGGSTRINPLDVGPVGDTGDPEERARRQTEMVSALVGCVLRRDLSPSEDALVGYAIAHLVRRASDPVTLADLAGIMRRPSAEMITVPDIDPDNLAQDGAAATFALGKLLDRSLRGMFDGQTTVALDWSGPGVVIDLSAVHHDADALKLVMVATTGWLQSVLARPDGPPRIQVLDEAWALLGDERTAKYLQACWKLSRAYGVANLAIVHRLSDLRAQADDGTTTSKVAMGLLADTQTRVLFRQSSDQISEARELLGLTSTEAELLPRLARGRALWKVAGRSAVVAHEIGETERAFCDTDARMLAR